MIRPVRRRHPSARRGDCLLINPVLRQRLQFSAYLLQSYLDPVDGARFLSGIARTLLPLIERTGVASASEVKISTLQSRLVEEMVAGGLGDAPAHVGRRLGNEPSMSCCGRFPNRNRMRSRSRGLRGGGGRVLSSRQRWWPAAGSNRRPSDFQKLG